jgi:hypothetical protein
MQEWEHRRLCYGWDDEKHNLVWADIKEGMVNGDTVDNRLNELGWEGWELISVEKINDLSHVVVSFYLKRPIEENRTGSNLQTHMLTSRLGFKKCWRRDILVVLKFDPCDC